MQLPKLVDRFVLLKLTTHLVVFADIIIIIVDCYTYLAKPSLVKTKVHVSMFLGMHTHMVLQATDTTNYEQKT